MEKTLITGKGGTDQIPRVFQELTDSEKQGIIAADYTSLTYIDRNLGRTLDPLKSALLAENSRNLQFGSRVFTRPTRSV